MDKVVAAHGGKAAWAAVGEISVHARSSGLALASKGARRRFRDYRLRVEPGRQRSAFEPYPGPGRRGVFEEGRVWIESEVVLIARRSPEEDLKPAPPLLRSRGKEGLGRWAMVLVRGAVAHGFAYFLKPSLTVLAAIRRLTPGSTAGR